MQLTTFITLILTVWCSPIEPVFYNRITQPEVYWIQPPFYYTPIFHYYPSYFRGWYTFPVHPDHRPHPHLTRDNQEDVQALERLTQLKESTRINPEKVILSSIGKSPNPIGFRDKSLLGFFDNLSLRLVSRMSILPNISKMAFSSLNLKTGLRSHNGSKTLSKNKKPVNPLWLLVNGRKNVCGCQKFGGENV